MTPDLEAIYRPVRKTRPVSVNADLIHWRETGACGCVQDVLRWPMHPWTADRTFAVAVCLTHGRAYHAT